MTRALRSVSENSVVALTIGVGSRDVVRSICARNCWCIALKLLFLSFDMFHPILNLIDELYHLIVLVYKKT